jgi:hypothetical protein
MDDERGTKVRFETLSAEKIPFGKNNFLEVARKKAITDDGVSEFISVSRGYYLPDGSEKYKKSITIPDDPNIKNFITERIIKL